MGEQTAEDDPPGWYTGERVPGYEGPDPVQETDSDDPLGDVPIDGDYIDAKSERAEITTTDEIDPTIHRVESSGAGYHWKNRGADTTDNTNNPRGSTAETSWQRGDVDPDDRDRFDRLYQIQHGMGRHGDDARKRRRQEERETVLQQVCRTEYQEKRARRLIEGEPSVQGWNAHYSGNVGLCIGYAYAVMEPDLESALESVRDVPYLSEKEASQAVTYAFTRLEERDISI